MFRRDIALKVGGYDSKFNFCEDFELFDRMAEHGSVVAIPEPLLQYRIHATSISMQRFFTMRKLSSFVRARHKARLAGNVLTYEQFEKDAKARSAVARFADTLHMTSGFYYARRAWPRQKGAKVKAVWYLGTSTLLNPFYAIPRIWNQVLSAKVKRLFGIRPKAEDSATSEPSAVNGTPAEAV